jgi:hypothetical protein
MPKAEASWREIVNQMAGPRTMTRIVGMIIAPAICSAACGQTFYGASGRVTGHARTDSRGVTTFYDPSNRITGRARTDANGAAASPANQNEARTSRLIPPSARSPLCEFGVALRRRARQLLFTAAASSACAISQKPENHARWPR